MAGSLIPSELQQPVPRPLDTPLWRRSIRDWALFTSPLIGAVVGAILDAILAAVVPQWPPLLRPVVVILVATALFVYSKRAGNRYRTALAQLYSDGQLIIGQIRELAPNRRAVPRITVEFEREPGERYAADIRTSDFGGFHEGDRCVVLFLPNRWTALVLPKRIVTGFGSGDPSIARPI